MNDLIPDALASLESFAQTGVVGFARKAYDRLREAGMSETTIGRVEDWTPEFAAELYSYLAAE